MKTTSWFRLIRLMTIIAILLLLAQMVLNIALYIPYLPTLAAEWSPNAFWTPEQTKAALNELGWRPVQMVALFFIIQLLVVGGLNCALGLLMLWRKSHDGFGLFVAFSFILTGTLGIGINSTEQVLPVWRDISYFLGGISWQLGFIMFYLFPDGRFVPRWTRWLLLGWLAMNIYAQFVAPDDSISLVVFALLVISTIMSQVYRYFRHADVTTRQQTKWLVYGLMLSVLFLPVGFAPILFRSLFLESGGIGLLWAVIIRLLLAVAGNFVPVVITIAILRHRLWDIDIIIRKTVQYTLITGLLGLVYFGSVVLLQNLFFGSQQSEIAIVISTLLIAALFNPLRWRIQNVIDRRFYRQKYDAAQALTRFATVARDEVEMEKLAAALVNVIETTVQPETVNVWLKPAANPRRNSHAE